MNYSMPWTYSQLWKCQWGRQKAKDNLFTPFAGFLHIDFTSTMSMWYWMNMFRNTENIMTLHSVYAIWREQQLHGIVKRIKESEKLYRFVWCAFRNGNEFLEQELSVFKMRWFSWSLQPDLVTCYAQQTIVKLKIGSMHSRTLFANW